MPLRQTAGTGADSALMGVGVGWVARPDDGILRGGGTGLIRREETRYARRRRRARMLERIQVTADDGSPMGGRKLCGGGKEVWKRKKGVP